MKLGDFGFASSKPKNLTMKGSDYYMAPEVHLGNSYNGKAADVFALGVLLFFMVIGKYPFVSATESDCIYKQICLNKMELFWRTTVRNRKVLKDLSPEFKQMISLMLTNDPIMRPSISELREMSWIKGKTLPRDTVQSELESIEPLISVDSDIISYH